MKTSALTLSILAAVCATLPALAHAGACDRYEYDKAEYYAKSIGKKVVDDRYDGSSDLHTTITSCNYNSYSKKFEVGVNIHWKGSLNSKNEYNSSGTITMNESGGSWTYSETSRSENVGSYVVKSTIAKVIGTIVIGGILNSSSD